MKRRITYKTIAYFPPTITTGWYEGDNSKFYAVINEWTGYRIFNQSGNLEFQVEETNLTKAKRGVREKLKILGCFK